MGKDLNRPNGEYHTARNKIQKSYCERDFGDDIMIFSLEHHVRRIIREANYIFFNFKIAFRFMDSKMLRMIHSKYI